MTETRLFAPKAIRRMLIPLVFEQLMIVLVGLVDTALLSGVNQSSLAAFSLVDSINQLLTQFFLAIGAGGAIIAAQYLGREDRKGAENTANQATLMVLAISTLIAVPVMLLKTPILQLLYPKIDMGIRQPAQQYLLLTAISYPFFALYNSGTSMLYAQGFSKLSMMTSITMNTGKILMNYVFITMWKMDIQGAGLATILSRVIGAVMVTWFLMDQHAPIHYTRPFKLSFRWSAIKRILTVALPSGFENIIFLTCKLIIGMMIAGYSGAMIAANAAANTISTYISVPANAINLVTITIISQCVGAGRGAEAKRISKMLQYGTIASLAVTSALVAIFINPIIGMLKLSPEAFEHTRQIMLVYCVMSVIIWTPAFGLPNSLRAAGDNRYVMYAAVFSVVVFRLLGSWVLGNLLGLQVHGIWYAMYLDWAVRSAFFIHRFRSGKWLLHRLV
ncbi:MAG: MATE family efflux transporter [Christensenellales bacterium]|nr:MATE family efflux transporter [Clostridiales bacterium]